MRRLDKQPSQQLIASFKKSRSELEGVKGFTFIGSDSAVVHKVSTNNIADFTMAAVPAAYAFQVTFTPPPQYPVGTGFAYDLAWTSDDNGTVSITKYRFIATNTNVQSWQITLQGSNTLTLPIHMKFYIWATTTGTISVSFPF